MAKEKKDKHKKDNGKDKKRKRDREDESKHAEKARKLVSCPGAYCCYRRYHCKAEQSWLLSKTPAAITCFTEQSRIATDRLRSLKRIYEKGMAQRRCKSLFGARKLRSRFRKGRT